MTDRLRGKLTLVNREGLVDETEDGPLQLGMFDFTLPCRSFVVEHKIADVGKVSVTAEFLLRFIRCVGSCAEDAAQSFFGYNRREMAYVLNEVENADYVQRADGRISLTPTGSNLFRPGVEEPLIFEVERKTARVGLDLISLAPAEKKFLSYFEKNLPELPLNNPEQASKATDLVPSSFRRFFRELAAAKIDPNATARRSLYSIDSVAAEDRFSTLVRVRLIATGLKPSHPEIDLSEWKSEYDLSDREAVVRAVADTIERLSISRRADNTEAYDLLVRIAPEYLKEWTRRDGLSVQRFYRHAFTSQGDIRANRQTVPIVGSLFTIENTRRLIGVANYGLRGVRRDAANLYWLVPQIPLWGSTVILSEVVEQFRERLSRTNEGLGPPAETVSLTVGRAERWVKEAFKLNHFSDGRVFPGGFEMLLVPGSFVAATVHSPMGQPSGYPVPLGFASFDERVVSRATQLLEENAGPFKMPEHLVMELARAGSVSKNEEAAPA